MNVRKELFLVFVQMLLQVQMTTQTREVLCEVDAGSSADPGFSAPPDMTPCTLL
jgi:hypothetical protein